MFADMLLTDMLNSQFRGLLVDTARHYLHPNTIKSAIDVLAYNKVADSRRPLFLFPVFVLLCSDASFFCQSIRSTTCSIGM